MKVDTSDRSPTEINLTDLYLEFKEQYRNVFMQQFGAQVFFYRTLGRKEYREILDDPQLNDFQKENIICTVCVIWPKEYDWNSCDAGIPGKLTDIILKNSFLDSIESRRDLLSFYRSEMYDLDNQITCLINEAFPNFDIEEIENWDVEKTTKYLTRAEWKLHNLHGLQFKEPEGDFYSAAQNQSKEEKVKSDEPKADTNIRGGEKKKKLTPDEIERHRQMEEFAKKFPEINPYADNALHEGIDGLKQQSVDTTAPALRPGF